MRNDRQRNKLPVIKEIFPGVYMDSRVTILMVLLCIFESL